MVYWLALQPKPVKIWSGLPNGSTPLLLLTPSPIFLDVTLLLH